MTSWRFRLKTWASGVECLLFWLPCMLTERWFFRGLNWPEPRWAKVSRWTWLHKVKVAVATRCVQGYYGAGRWWDMFGKESLTLKRSGEH